MARAQQASNQEAAAEKAAKKVAAFKKHGNVKVRAALTALDKILPLTNRKSFTYDDSQVTKITGAIQARLERIVKAFASGAGAAADVEL